MNVFDLALDSNDKEWFMHLHKVISDMKSKVTIEIPDIRSGLAYAYGIDWAHKKIDEFE